MSDPTAPSERFYSPAEVAQHNVYNDAWVSLFGKVLDITLLIRDHLGTPSSALTTPLVRFAGEDITHWFDATTLQPKTHVDPISSLTMPFTPYGRFVHVAPGEPTSRWSTNFQVPWWLDEQYIIGTLTTKSRLIRIVNMLTHQNHVLEVCSEETLAQIQARYLLYNAHCQSYTWKRLGRILDVDKTLAENGIDDESDEFELLGINEQYHLPSLQIYYNDDLTVA